MMSRPAVPVQKSERARLLLDAIESYTAGMEYPPTIRELGDLTGITSTSVVNWYLDKMEAAGMIERDRRVARGIRVVKNGRE